jgi:hypothetical protein
MASSSSGQSVFASAVVTGSTSSGDDQTSVCILLLGGLPAAGKTSVCKYLRESPELAELVASPTGLEIEHIQYDELEDALLQRNQGGGETRQAGENKSHPEKQEPSPPAGGEGAAAEHDGGAGGFDMAAWQKSRVEAMTRLTRLAEGAADPDRLRAGRRLVIVDDNM